MKRKIMALVIVLGIMALTACGSTEEKKLSTTDESVSGNDISDGEVEVEEIPDGMFEQVALTSDEHKKVASRLVDTIDSTMKSNAYIQVYVSDDDCDTYIYNKKGECAFVMYDGSFVEVIKSNGIATMIGSEVVSGQDMSILDLVKSVVESSLTDTNIKMYSFEARDEENRNYVNKYRIIIDDYDSVKNVYSKLGDDYSDLMVSNMKQSIGDEIQLSYYITEFDDGQIQVECAVAEDGNDMLSWYFDGWMVLDDWELGSEWYADDFDTYTAEELDAMVLKVMETLRNRVVDFAEKNGLEVITTGDVSGNDIEGE